MFLTERQDENFNLVLDIDVKMGADHKWEHCVRAEQCIVDKDDGTSSSYSEPVSGCAKQAPYRYRVVLGQWL
ncbi:hypothetical protein Pmar_PMAR026529 [Perkinsus marinus ATCC 50983]|uniref:Uncharacterized protein n=1 Tax=Perkinsus marinus (strain ATCC 50983 / TXsc) TaxID=423536 RepID=C5LDT1_PERM5|nr:hypothetical protein Pmar_PMAR026529 [Perkinsus marinus ATCC 50983]EER05095.1 hypothetical protein Pmar_PMAR026529 [Perkinsus marinus ATCC 50983]|eukprot:XP_002773279.1 hypothetical protein Pmar_PMAR026529 [Perkinsus marinus ATCC 50983]